jgi:hypothetical protein
MEEGTHKLSMKEHKVIKESFKNYLRRGAYDVANVV